MQPSWLWFLLVCTTPHKKETHKINVWELFVHILAMPMMSCQVILAIPSDSLPCILGTLLARNDSTPLLLVFFVEHMDLFLSMISQMRRVFKESNTGCKIYKRWFYTNLSMHKCLSQLWCSCANSMLQIIYEHIKSNITGSSTDYVRSCVYHVICWLVQPSIA